MEPATQKSPDTTQQLGNTNMDNGFDAWHAPEDPDKPRLPYIPGFSIQISRHKPPPSFATDEEPADPGYQERAPLSEAYLRSVTHTEAVVANPPEEGIPIHPSQAETAQLVLTSPIAIGSARGAQIVVCTVTPQNGDPFTAIAKIYDPLYYNFERDIGHSPRDCVSEADEHYIVEAWAYESLKKAGYTGSFAPEYYGSWTFTLPIVLKGSSTTRPIRLILIERLHGTSIEASRIQNNYKRGGGKDAFHYPEEYRLEVLARALDGYVRQAEAGVVQRDFAGRNVMLVPDENPTDQSGRISGLVMPRIVLIDYNNAGIKHLSPDTKDTRPENPAWAFWSRYLWSDMAGWVPNTWRDDKVQQGWMFKRFCGPDRIDSYLPVPEWMKRLAEQKD
ncbi:hypothetical protein LA080_008382 [Diaporthe eres]|nr:hypothetical protein LA080_008382 [Diaporthe eres]